MEMVGVGAAVSGVPLSVFESRTSVAFCTSVAIGEDMLIAGVAGLLSSIDVVSLIVSVGSWVASELGTIDADGDDNPAGEFHSVLFTLSLCALAGTIQSARSSVSNV